MPGSALCFLYVDANTQGVKWGEGTDMTLSAGDQIHSTTTGATRDFEKFPEF